MKKYIALVALIAATGCGGADKDKTEITTTETTTEFETETDEEVTYESETETEKQSEEETKAVNSVVNKTTTTENTEKAEKAGKAESFENSDTYKDLKSLASNAGFDISYSGNTVTFKTYITDDTIDYIKEKDKDYFEKWDEHCGLYEEFCSEAVNIVKNDGLSADINVAFEVVGRSDNQVYYRNENGSSIYDAYVHENQL